MTSSEVEICNIALTRLGAKRILIITAKGLESELSNQFYEITRDELLSSYNWAFAIGRITLATLAGPTLSKFSYKYQLPLEPSCFKVLTLIDAASATYADITSEWMVEGGELYTDQTPCAIKYIKQVTNTGKFPILFKKALGLKLAVEMCMKLTQDAQLYSIVVQEAMAAYLNATANEGSWTRQDDQPERSW